ncbi:MAG: DUF58 domain-containing protein [Acidobacteria bacterium]|nr:DUF58 domain-containing protein [Acidobacteriota bacterium]
MAGPARYLDPKVLARIGSLDLKAKTVVEGVLSGLHRSPKRGYSVEFAEYRQYLPGDALATIDWKVYARSDRHYVKKFEEDTNLDCHLLVDISGSMAYGSHGVTKRDYACYLAASLAYLMHRQRDAVGFIAFDEAIVQRLPPSARASHLRAVLLGLERLPQGVKTNVAKPLGDLAKVLAKRGLVVVISDLLDDPAGVIQGLRHFRQRGTDVIVFHVLDPQELHFTFADVARFRDVESASEVFADPAAVRGEYLAAVGGFIDTYRQQLGGAGIDYHLLDTSKPLDLALVAYLKARGRG